MTRLVIDPVTRVGGPLRVEVDVRDGVVADAWTSATMFRGLERALIGRDPRDAWLLAQRICGTCNGVHALASVRAVEQALGIAIPGNARLIRNLLAGSQLVTGHAAGFYLRHAPDWADLGAAPGGDPGASLALARSISDAPTLTVGYLARIRDRLAALIEAGQPGPFGPAQPDDPAYRLSPAADLLFAAHYLQALDWRRSMTRFQTYLGGKSPHPQTFLVGGMALVTPWGGPARATGGEHPRRPDTSAPAAFSERGQATLSSLVAGARDFVDHVYLPDVLYLADAYRDSVSTGVGLGNLLAFGDFPEDDSIVPRLLLPRGRVMDRDLSRVDSVDQSGVAECVGHAHYAEDAGLRPAADGATNPRYQGPPPPVTSLDGAARYSWSKAPRYFDDPMEVGPAARMAVAHAAGGPAGAVVDRVLGNLGLETTALFSTLGRIVARAIEAKLLVDRLDGWLGELMTNLGSGDLALADISDWDQARWPGETAGWSLGESAGGAVGHWLRISDRRIVAYQVVDGSTWNLSPRDGRGRRGALEEALVGTPVQNPASPLEVLRVIRSFDPCPACAVQ
jgi:hydrogenase large subunit